MPPPLRPAVLALLVALVPGCRAERPPSGITVLIEAPPESLDSRLTLTATGQRIAQLITPGLVTFDDSSTPVPDLAESFRELSPTLVEFTLRPGLTFHDGSTLTAEDVKATYDSMGDAALASPRAERYAAVERVTVVDARTVRFHLRRPYAPLLAELSLGILPAERAPAAGKEEQGRAPIGAGPFRFESQPDEVRRALCHLVDVGPLVTFEFGALLGGAIVTEKVFAWPGMGTLLLSAIEKRDYNTVRATVLVFTCCYVLVNALTDGAYALVDPRVRRRA